MTYYNLNLFKDTHLFERLIEIGSKETKEKRTTDPEPIPGPGIDNNGNNNKRSKKKRISTSQSSPTSSDCNNTTTSHHHNNMSSDGEDEEGSVEDQMMDSPSESTTVETAKVSSSSTVIGINRNNTTTSTSSTIVNSNNNNETNQNNHATSCSSSALLELEAKEKEISNLEASLNEKSSVIKNLEGKLEDRSYDKIKRELNILKAEISQYKSRELYFNQKTKALESENAALKAAVCNTQLATGGHGGPLSTSARHPLVPSSFGPPLQNVEAFSSLLGEEIATNYAKLFAKQAAAAAAASAAHVANSLSPRPASAEDAKSIRSDASPTTHSNEETSSLKVSSSPPVTGSPRIDHSHRDPSQRASLDRLQTNLRANIEKYMNENLNTMNISRCVRELLSVHNIGQRLFAKYVLGLSQGTVSELLSKPKPWDKLTEKGRDSYRKMHAWAADESCIYELKSLVPRKGKEAASFKQDDPAAEERIQQILSEAQRAMVTPRSNGSRVGMPFLSNGTDPSKMSLNHLTSDMRRDDDSSDGEDERGISPLNSFERKHEVGEGGIPSEVLVRLYQEELAKMIGAGQMAGDGSQRSQEEIRQALAIYHQELSRLSHLASASQLPPGSDPFARLGLMNGSSPFLPNSAMNALAAFDSRRINDGRGCNRGGGGSASSVTSHRDRNNSDVNPSVDHHSSAFQLVRPKLESDRGGSDVNVSGNNTNTGKQFASSPSLLFPGSGSIKGSNPDSGAEDLSSTASPLARMQSITNSLLSQSSVPVAPSVPSRPAKAVLPPITQQQFDQYNNLNTEDIVKHVKDQLSQFSISQRLFGESVLGLSQGSVSDLLARPKPWHMLTQKGREPFIRMKMFLEDESAVHKLVASQYKIAPEKLMRSTPGGFGNPAAVTTLPTAHLNNNNNIGTIGAGIRRPEDRRPEIVGRKNPSPMTVMDSLRSAGSTPEYPNPASLLASLPLQTLLTGSSGTSLRRAIPGLNNNPSRPSSGSYNFSTSAAQPSVYEMAALTTDLDTQAITTKIKETLMAHNIGQKIFGEVVLGLSQGSVSELLSKPKPWHMLSIKGREPFIRMQLWLTDPNNIEKLQALKNERREANKRRRTNGDDGGRNMSSRDSPLYSFSNNSSGFSPLSGSQGFGSGSTGASSAKKPRILFSEEQKEALRLAFSMDPYPSTATIEYLAGELRLSVRTITNWFHNHRMRLKQVTSSSGDEVGPGMSLPFGMGRDGTTFDPVTFKMALSAKLAEIKLREMSGEAGKGYFGLSSHMFDNQNSCSSGESSIHGDEEMGTLDLSMTNNTSGHGGNQQSPRSFDSDRSNNSDDYDDAPTPPPEPVTRSGSSRRKPQHVTSSSSRRKPAQPQWVDPGLEFSGDEDDMDASDNEADPSSGVINGVCIRQPDLSSKAVLEKVSKASPLSSNFSDGEEKAD